MELTTIVAGPDLPGALCAQSDPEAWFPDTGGSNRYAIKICRRCPAQADCLTWAIQTRQEHGIWAATTPRQRRTIRANQANRGGH